VYEMDYDVHDLRSEVGAQTDDDET
jgi:hypothetical protein